MQPLGGNRIHDVAHRATERASHSPTVRIPDLVTAYICAEQCSGVSLLFCDTSVSRSQRLVGETVFAFVSPRPDVMLNERSVLITSVREVERFGDTFRYGDSPSRPVVRLTHSEPMPETELSVVGEYRVGCRIERGSHSLYYARTVRTTGLPRFAVTHCESLVPPTTIDVTPMVEPSRSRAISSASRPISRELELPAVELSFGGSGRVKELRGYRCSVSRHTARHFHS